jgi:hypothetical protein
VRDEEGGGCGLFVGTIMTYLEGLRKITRDLSVASKLSEVRY